MAFNTGISTKDGARIAQGLSRMFADTHLLYLKSHEVSPLAKGANDQPTLDLLTQHMDIHEKNAWMLRSLLKK